MRSNLLLIFFFVIALLVGFLIPQCPSTIMIWVTLALAIFIVSFANMEWGLYILIFSMLLSPEFIVGETAGSSLGRGVTLRIEDFLLVFLGFSWLAKTAVNKELGLFLKTPLNKAILVYVFACLISTGVGIMTDRVEPKTGILFVLKYVEYFIVYFMVVNSVKDKDQVKRLIFCLLLTCLIVSIIGIFQIPAGGRVSAPFEGESGEPNTFGGYLLFIGAVAAGVAAKSDNKRFKNLLVILIITMAPAFLFTQSRSSYLGFIPTCLVLAFFTKRRVITVGVIALIFLLSPFLLPSQVKNRILYTFSQPKRADQVIVGGVRLDSSTSARLISFKEILADWPKHPIFGYGVTGYGFADAQFPRVLIETGIIGMIAFLYLLYSIFKMTINNLMKISSPDSKGLILGFLAGYIGLIFHALGANTFIIVRIMEPFWLLTGIIAVLPAMDRHALKQKNEDFPPDRRFASVN